MSDFRAWELAVSSPTRGRRDGCGMTSAWGEYGFGEWLWTQVHNTIRSRPRVPVPVPPMDLPGCAAGAVSWRRWFTWRQANSVTAFSVQLTREIVAALAVEGVTPIETWLRHHTAGVAVGGGHRPVMLAYGDVNGVYAESRVRIPRGSVRLFAFEQEVLPSVYGRYPISDIGGTASSAWLPGPYGFRAGITRMDPQDSFDTVRVVSPGYFCRYRSVSSYPGRYMTNWPLNPAEERETLIYPDKPRRAGQLARGEIPGVAEYTLGEVLRWCEYLGCRVGEAHSGWVRKRGQSTGREYDVYVVTAPATFTVSEDEVRRRALPHTAVTVRPGIGSTSQRPGVGFSIFNGLPADIDPDSTGAYTLTIASTGG